MLILTLALLGCRNKDLVNYDSEGISVETADSQAQVLDGDGDGVPDDEDCDPDDPDVSTPSTWYEDADGDGYGSDVSTEACEQPSGFVAEDGDCDDGDGAYHPGAAEDDCTDPNDYNCDGSVGYADEDGDGWAACEECDDADASVHPDAQEVCNGIDDDCDTYVDDEDDSLDLSSATTWYTDMDGDGYGDASDFTQACEQPTGYVADPSDCDDTQAGVNPAATEICNGVDDDCDGLVDDDDSSVDTSTGSTWYADGDGDGYGDASSSVEACSQPSGYVADNTDCDDGASGTNPAALEICDGSEDEDCDGSVDEADASDAQTWYTDSDGDGYGDASSSTTSCDQPSGSVSDDSDCDDSDADVNPGETEICNEVDDDCDGLVDDDDSSVDLSTGDTYYVDSDGDGYGDSSSTTTACEEPSGYADVDTDCDDADSGVNPGATESCNAVDDDCNGDVDDGGVCPCNVETYGGGTYLFCESSEAWTDARDTCASYGYTIATIDDSSENSWMDSTADTYSTGKWWIGFNDRATEGTFMWESGSSSTYTNWRSGEPNDSGGNEDCTQLNRYTDQTWNDEPCSSSFYYICED